MGSLSPTKLADQISEFEPLDQVAKPLQRFIRTVLPGGSAQRDLVSGRQLGHPLHPALTDVVIGSWGAALLLDLFGGSKRRAADRLIGIGVLAAAPTAVAGLADWSELQGRDRRFGMAHALGNTSALLLFASSWFLRARGRRASGVALSLAGTAVMSGSAWMGGHLSFSRGIGVNQNAFQTIPGTWQTLLKEEELEEGKLLPARVGDVDVLVVRHGADVHAMLDRCNHLGCQLSDGELRDDGIVCPCHGSTFALDGTVVRGPATADQPTLEVRVEDGKVQARRVRRR
jgi:nitrite reductase/ring-hydroxylating ferredoxin subunit/uncharacterized membrane protein